MILEALVAARFNVSRRHADSAVGLIAQQAAPGWWKGADGC
jgi:hypothetical protein